MDSWLMLRSTSDRELALWGSSAAAATESVEGAYLFIRLIELMP